MCFNLKLRQTVCSKPRDHDLDKTKSAALIDTKLSGSCELSAQNDSKTGIVTASVHASVSSSRLQKSEKLILGRSFWPFVVQVSHRMVKDLSKQ